MRRWFSGISLRWKLASVTVLATAVALIIAGLIMASYDARTYEQQKAAAVTSAAEILAASLAAPLVFDDTRAAEEYMNALSANPEIVVAAVYSADRNLFAHYVRPAAGNQAAPQRPGEAGYSFEGGDLSVFVPVREDKSVVGTVYIRANVEPVATRVARYTLILLGIGIASLALALPISLRLHRIISNPLEELANRNAIINTTFEAVDHGILVVDPKTKVTFLNERLPYLSGLLPGDLTIGVNFADFLLRWMEKIGVPKELHKHRVEQLQSQEKLREEFTLPDGKTLEFRQSPLPQGGFVRTYTDISEEKIFQEQLLQAKTKAEEAANAKSHFLAAMSHEIRTPMNGVIGLIELVRATSLTDEQKQMVEIIRQSGISLLDVINDILDYSKIEAGRMTVEMTEFVLGDLIETTAEVIGGHTSSKFLDIACAIDSSIDTVVIGDPVRVRQIIINMMSNAVKFTDKGVVSIEATAHSTTDDVVTVLFEITDTGMGIEAEKQKQLFRPFTQADYSTTRRFGGTGLGLSICKNLVELMGGEIGVRSVVGRGSTFWAKIPFQRVPLSERANAFDGYRSVLGGLRILVCDNMGSRSAAAWYLRSAGTTVIEATSIADSIDALRGEVAAGRPVDAVILNVRVGDDSAHGFFEKANRHKELANIKVMIIVPRLSAGTAQLVATKAFSAFVSAPIQRANFFDAVATVTGRTLNKKKEADSTSVQNFLAPSAEDAAAQGCLILVAEDNQTNQFVIKSQLRRLGFAAEFAADGREAWETLKREEKRYGLLITDCHMPFLDGYQLTGLIRDRELSTGGRLPVVALTANALQGEREICRAAGMDDYMFKPTDLKTLDGMIAKWLPRAVTLRKLLDQNGAAAAGATRVNNADSQPPIDMALLGQILGNNEPQYLREMLALYWSTEAEIPAKLRALSEARDGAALALAAHAAKGAAASVSAPILTEFCLMLERAAGQGDWTIIEPLVEKVDRAFEDVHTFIDGELLKNGA